MPITKLAEYTTGIKFVREPTATRTVKQTPAILIRHKAIFMLNAVKFFSVRIFQKIKTNKNEGIEIISPRAPKIGYAR